MMDIKVIFSDDNMSWAEIEEFWELGINMDDWDYLLICPADAVREEECDVYDEYVGETFGHIRYIPCNWYLERMMNGSCDNIWYKVNYRGEEVAIGVAYHA